MCCVYVCSLCSWDTRKPGNEAMSMAYLHFWRLFISMYSSWMWQMSRNDKNVYPYLLCFKLGTQTILEMYYLLQWHTDHLNLVLFHHVHYILNPHITSLYTSPLSCKLKWEKTINTKRLNTFPTHFQCTGYLHIQMLIQMPSHADSSIIVFNTVVPWIRLIFNPMP